MSFPGLEHSAIGQAGTPPEDTRRPGCPWLRSRRSPSRPRLPPSSASSRDCLGPPLADPAPLLPGTLILRLPGPVGEVAAGGQGVRVPGAGHPLLDGQQRGELVPGPGRIPRRPGPAGEFVAGVEGARVLAALDPLTEGEQRGVLVPRPGRVPRLPGPAG